MQNLSEEKPLNIAPALRELMDRFLTHDDTFFVRNHGNIPDIDPETYQLKIDGLVDQPMAFSLSQLKTNFEAHSTTVTLTCAGNRREELHAIKPIHNEIIWGLSAISNAQWRGVLLRDVLEAALAHFDEGYHIAFEGMDDITQDRESIHFGASIPMQKAWDSDVLLAYAMNDAPLSPKRGFPIRLVVPGFIGARSVKWLRSIRIQESPSDNYYQQRAYKYFTADVAESNADWDSAPMITEQALNAIICRPQHAETLTGSDSPIQVTGFALPQGDHIITRIELSVDGGWQWSEARITSPALKHTWCFWEATVHLPAGNHELVVRAFDSGGHSQPANLSDVWNFKGYMNNAWHRIEILVSS